MRDNIKTTESRMYKEMAGVFSELVDEQIERGTINEPKKRWDKKDQEAFEKVTIEELLDSPYYLGIGQYKCDDRCGWVDDKQKKPSICPNCGRLARPDLFPAHRQDIIDLHNARRAIETVEAMFEEGIGSGKTFKFAAILWLMVTEVITKYRPLEYYGLAEKSSGISFVCMSRNASLAKEVTFQQVLPFFDCPFYAEYFPPKIDFQKINSMKKYYPSVLRFPKKIVIFPGTGSALSAIGYNLFGGCIDEVNYLEVVDDSKKAIRGEGYDAAQDMYEAIMARMISRFEPTRLRRDGKLPGLLVMMSNPCYPMDFLERKYLESRTNPSIFFRRRCTWEGHPKERYSGETFKFDVLNCRVIEEKK